MKRLARAFRDTVYHAAVDTNNGVVVYPVAQASKLKYPLAVEDDLTHLCSLAKPTLFELVLLH